MDIKDNTFYPLIVLFFFLGLVIGYVIHQPETTTKIFYVNSTTEKTPEIMAEKTPEVSTTTQVVPSAVPTPVADFSIKESYDPFKDKPTTTMDLMNWRVVPQEVTIRSGESVLIEITAISVPGPLTLILNKTSQKNIGTTGAAFITFNKKGTYPFKVIIPNPDPSYEPQTYVEKGAIIVN